MRMASSRGAAAEARARVVDEFMRGPSLRAIKRDVERVEVAEPAVRPVMHRAIEDERHPLLGRAAVRAQGRVETGEVVPDTARADRGMPAGDGDQVALAILGQLEGTTAADAVEHFIHAGNRGDTRQDRRLVDA